MFGLAPCATEEGGEGPSECAPSPPQELEGGVWSAPNFQYAYNRKTCQRNQCPQNLQNIHKINIPIDFEDQKQVLIDLNALHTTFKSNALLHNYVEVLGNFSPLENF